MSPFLFTIFLCTASLISTALSSSSLICYSAPSILPLIASSTFLYQLLYYSLLFDSSFNSIKLLAVFIHSFPEFFEHLYNHFLELYQVSCLSPLSSSSGVFILFVHVEYIFLSPHFA